MRVAIQGTWRRLLGGKTDSIMSVARVNSIPGDIEGEFRGPCFNGKSLC